MLVKKVNAFSLIELMVAMGVVAVLIGLSTFGIMTLQRSARDSERTAILGNIAEKINEYRLTNSRYPATQDVNFTSETFRINNTDISLELESALSSSNNTSMSGTKYYYNRTLDGFNLCAVLESGTVQNVGTERCPENI